MQSPKKLSDILPKIEAKLKMKFKSKDLLFLAFVHRSFVNEDKETNQHNERLEFLGDSVLGVLIAEYLYEKWPDETEGTLSQFRSLLVEAGACIKYMKVLELEPFIMLGKGESQSLGRGRETILANVFEALIGAMYLDQGLNKTRNFFFGNLQKCVEEIIESPSRNYKADLQDYTQKNFQTIPEYKLVQEVGPDHAKEFTIAVFIQSDQQGEGRGASKKQAEQEAAKNALNNIEKRS